MMKYQYILFHIRCLKYLTLDQENEFHSDVIPGSIPGPEYHLPATIIDHFVYSNRHL